MNVRTIIADYFSFNRAEQRGISILLVILLGMILLNRFMPEQALEPPPGTERFKREAIAFGQELARAEEQERVKAAHRKNTRYAFHAYTRDTSYRERPQRAVPFAVELNSADTLDLQRIRGIGPGFARRIVGYRKKLGGYTDRSQLLEVYGMNPERYAQIRDFVAVNLDSVKKIDINNASFKTLIGHPYFPFDLTKEIIIYRKKAKCFGSKEELMKVKGVTDSVFLKVSPYIVVK